MCQDIDAKILILLASRLSFLVMQHAWKEKCLPVSCRRCLASELVKKH